MRKAFLTTDHANFLNRRRDTHNTHSALSLSLSVWIFFLLGRLSAGGGYTRITMRVAIKKPPPDGHCKTFKYIDISILYFEQEKKTFNSLETFFSVNLFPAWLAIIFFCVYRCYDLEREEMPGLASPAWHDFIFTNRLQMNNLREEKKTQENE